ncbi:circadian clock-controlled protein daywake-like [Diabrotica undecimpunctata]|uniref:circadian clock-controlled protein daywake-like n=1 Tax=Diabrotica undecimpunctata TaxID=50387 RepID=UPI003B63DB51
MKWLFILSCIVFVESAKNLPSFVEVCPRDNKEAAECLQRNIKSLIPRLAKGIPELFVPPLGPLVLPSAEIASSKSFSSTLKDVKLYHLDNVIIHDLFLNFDTKSFGVDASFPSLGVEGDYKMNGKLLVLELNSEGKTRGNMTNLRANLTVFFDVVTLNGKEHLHITGTKEKLDIEKANFVFDDLFKGNEELTERATKILNENYRVLLDEFTPVFEKILSALTVNIVEQIYKRYPFDVIFPKKN